MVSTTGLLEQAQLRKHSSPPASTYFRPIAACTCQCLLADGVQTMHMLLTAMQHAQAHQIAPISMLQVHHSPRMPLPPGDVSFALSPTDGSVALVSGVVLVAGAADGVGVVVLPPALVVTLVGADKASDVVELSAGVMAVGSGEVEGDGAASDAFTPGDGLLPFTANMQSWSQASGHAMQSLHRIVTLDLAAGTEVDSTMNQAMHMTCWMSSPAGMALPGVADPAAGEPLVSVTVTYQQTS